MSICTKKAWASEASAKRKLTEIRKRRDRHRGAMRVEVRHYRCPDCSAWHLTSHVADYTLPSQRRPLRVLEMAE